jgi:hypothetical protein
MVDGWATAPRHGRTMMSAVVIALHETYGSFDAWMVSASTHCRCPVDTSDAQKEKAKVELYHTTHPAPTLE